MDPTLIARKQPTVSQRSVERVERGVGIVFVVALLFFLVAAALYGAVYVYAEQLRSSIDEATRELAQVEEELEPEIIAEIARADRGLLTARSLLREHVHPSNIFKLLEDNTLETVHYDSFSYALDQATITLSGEVDNFANLTRQIAILRSLSAVTAVSFSNIALKEDGGIGFSFGITFNKSLLHF